MEVCKRIMLSKCNLLSHLLVENVLCPESLKTIYIYNYFLIDIKVKNSLFVYILDCTDGIFFCCTPLMKSLYILIMSKQC